MFRKRLTSKSPISWSFLSVTKGFNQSRLRPAGWRLELNNCFYNYNNTGKIWSDYTYFSIIADHKTNRDITNNDSEYTPYL